MPACSGVQLSGCQADERCQYRVADPPIPGATVSSVLDAFGAAQLVKIDCEGCEYLLLPDLLRNRHRIAYVDLECHNREDVDLETASLCRAIADEKGRRFLSPMDTESPCWTGPYTESVCCASASSSCWDEEYTYVRCCQPGRDSSVLRYSAHRPSPRLISATTHVLPVIPGASETFSLASR